MIEMTEHPAKILVVDDETDLEPLMLQRMRRTIRDGRYEFVFAHNGVEALQKLEIDDSIDMVLSDINMPQMDGLTLLDQIAARDPNLRSVIISAYGDMQNIRTAMNRGAFDFVTKPLDFEDLQITIDRTLQHVAKWRDALASRDKLVVLQNELGVASQMQQSILPSHFPQGLGYRVFGHMTPARNVGGDFFDVIRLENDCLGLGIADVSDKGVSAALFMMSCRTLLKGAAIGAPGGPGEVLREVNNILSEDNETSMFVTLFYATYDPQSRVLTYANGGHNPPLFVHADGASELLPLTGGVALALVPDLLYQQDSVTLAPDDTVIFYTDGVTEAINAEGDQFEVSRMQEIFAAAPPKDPESVVMDLLDAVNAFAGDMPQFDDITCLALRGS